MNSNSLLSSIPALVVISLCCFTEYGHAISCYNCNSAAIYDRDGICSKIPKDARSGEFIVNCSSIPPRDGLEWDRCRTILQDVEGEIRLIRSCATHPDKTKENRCIDRTGTSKIKIRYCECDKDLCNGATFQIPSLVFLGILSTMALSVTVN